MQIVTFKDLGPIKKLSINLKPGITVLRGGQGVGKSTAQLALSSLLGKPGKQPLSARDGAKRGTVELGDATMVVTARQCKKSGELEVDTIEGSLDVAALVDPQIKDEDRADAARIRALVSLSGVEPDATAYFALAGGEEKFEELGVDVETDCPVKLASRVKAKLEAEARRAETRVTALEAKVNAAKASLKNVDVDSESDETKLWNAHSEAVKRRATITAKIDAASEALDRQRHAQAAFETATESYDGPTISLAESVYESRVEEETLAELRLQKAQSDYNCAMRDRDKAETVLDAARSHFATIESVKQSLNIEIPPSPKADDIEAADAAVDAAMAAIEKGVEVRKAQAATDELFANRLRLKSLRATAELFRDRAASVDDVLSSLIPDGPLRIHNGRLVTATDRDDRELFSQLSHGERWKLAIDLVADQLGENGLLVIPQIAWEGLTEKTQADLQTHIVSRGIVAIAAEAVDGPLTASEYQ